MSDPRVWPLRAFAFDAYGSTAEPPEELGFGAEQVVHALTDLAPLVRR